MYNLGRKDRPKHVECYPKNKINLRICCILLDLLWKFKGKDFKYFTKQVITVLYAKKLPRDKLGSAHCLLQSHWHALVSAERQPC
jgi:hypothetical protein